MDYLGQSHFDASYFDADLLGGAGAPEVADATLAVTWTFGGAPFANEAFDYVVKTGANEIVKNGTSTTNGSGVQIITIPGTYSGQKLVVHGENVGPDGVTTGKVHGTQVVTAT